MDMFGNTGPMEFGLGAFEPAPDSWGTEAQQFDDPFRTSDVQDGLTFPVTWLCLNMLREFDGRYLYGLLLLLHISLYHIYCTHSTHITHTSPTVHFL